MTNLVLVIAIIAELPAADTNSSLVICA